VQTSRCVGPAHAVCVPSIYLHGCMYPVYPSNRKPAFLNHPVHNLQLWLTDSTQQLLPSAGLHGCLAYIWDAVNQPALSFVRLHALQVDSGALLVGQQGGLVAMDARGNTVVCCGYGLRAASTPVAEPFVKARTSCCSICF
jgi:hypothetical protein